MQLLNNKVHLDFWFCDFDEIWKCTFLYISIAIIIQFGFHNHFTNALENGSLLLFLKTQNIQDFFSSIFEKIKWNNPIQWFCLLVYLMMKKMTGKWFIFAAASLYTITIVVEEIVMTFPKIGRFAKYRNQPFLWL